MVTEKEFKELFELEEGCKVDQENINRFVKMVQGAYLVHRAVFENNVSIETTFTNGKKAWLSTSIDGHSNWRDHVKATSSLPHIFINFRYKEELSGD